MMERAAQVPGLRELSRFVREGGPAFMQAAPGVGTELRKVRDQGRARTKFRFDLAQQRVELAQGAEAKLDAEIRKKGDERRDLSEALEAHRTSGLVAQKGLDEWRPRATTLDQVARRLIAQYRIAQEVLAALEVTVEADGTVSDELGRAIRSSRRLDEADPDEPHYLVELADELRADVEALDLRTRSKAIKDAKSALEGFRKVLHAEIRGRSWRIRHCGSAATRRSGSAKRATSPDMRRRCIGTSRSNGRTTTSCRRRPTRPWRSAGANSPRRSRT